MNKSTPSYIRARFSGQVAQTAASISRQFARHYLTAAKIMDVDPRDLVLPLEVRESGIVLDVKFTEFAEFLGEMVDNVRESTDDEVEETLATALREMQSIAIRGVE